MTKETEGFIDNFIEYKMAKEDHANIESYVKRGRQFKALSDDELSKIYIEEVRRWALTPPPWDFFERREDAQSEFTLRNIQRPLIEAAYLEKIKHVLDEAQKADDRGDIDVYRKEHLEYLEAMKNPN